MIEYIERLLQGAEVQWKTLGEVAELKRGTSVTKKTSTPGNYPVISGGQKPAYYIDTYNREGATITIAGSGVYAGFVQYWNEQIFVADAFSIKVDEHLLLTRFVYYFLLTIQDKIYNLKSVGGIPHVYSKDVACFTIPIPPLEVQREIVRILDKFTELEAELESELESELECRRKQYGYYLHYLFDFAKRGIEVRRMKIGEIGKICMCKRILKNQTTSSGDIPFYKIGTFGGVPDAYISQALFEDYKNRYPYPQKGDILISASGTIGKTVVFDGTPSYFQDSNIVWLKHNEEFVLNSYLKYCYCLKPWSVAKGGTIERLYNDNILRAVISVPQIEEQQRIVRILDKFDTLTTSISEGLPREIELRRKQYEYYRERLLSFDNDNA